ncbi:MAG TPA: circularly permuted type 2 ATP-grasp protein [Alphaproteobacteria bacterium]|nr:circularly permuted type 2 ATP-grasp protein [Alphaproteobacteria bacterium]
MTQGLSSHAPEMPGSTSGAAGPVADRAGGAYAGNYDEMVDGTRAIRRAWQPLIGALQAMPKGAFAERVERVHRQHEDISVAYRIEPEVQGSGNRRPFDLLPMVITPEEWSGIEAGLGQRARLMDAIVADIYGARRLIAEGLIPAALVYGNPRFLRPCSGSLPAGSGHVHAYAADLVRTKDGSWQVVADRLQAPSGIGFALQNRSLLARTVPELFRAHMVERIEPFFDLWRDVLAALSPRRDGQARIAVMTPGPYNPGFFEHVYLARQLGATLVEGADLTMRFDRVFVKTLGVLQQVDVILRFMEDDYCDPLELRGTSVLGVAGLLQAVRAGTVVVANALGASVAETPALRPFLPRLCEKLLGEALALPSPDTQWLGAAPAADPLAGLPPDAALRPAFPSRRDEAPEEQDSAREAFLQEVRQRPYLYVAEAPAEPSVIPVWTPEGLVPQPLTLRVFCVREGEGYRAMPGGFAQVPHRPGGAVAPLRQLAMSKDTWVLLSEDRLAAPAHRAPPPIQAIRRPPDELRSRTADNLFWMGRYMERLDNAARMMRSAALRLAVERFGPGQRQELAYLARLLVEAALIDAGAGEMMPDSSGLMLALSVSGARGRGLDEAFTSVRRIAHALRDRLSNDVWNVVIGNLREARERIQERSAEVDGLIAALDNLIGVVAAFGGMVSENMTRGSGWRFLDIGRRLERGVYASSIIKQLLASRREDAESALHLALELSDSTITYRSRYFTAIQTGPVVDLILADEANPRSIAFQIQAIIGQLNELAHSFERVSDRPEQALAETILASIRGAKIDRLDDAQDQSARQEVGELLGNLRRQFLALSEAITRAYFSHVRAPYAVGYGSVRL